MVINKSNTRAGGSLPSQPHRMIRMNSFIGASSSLLAHELGHYFGLRHTFANSVTRDPFTLQYNPIHLPDCSCNPEIPGFCPATCTSTPCGCDEFGDFIADTPVDPAFIPLNPTPANPQFFFCPSGTSPCVVTTPGGQTLTYTPPYDNIMSYYAPPTGPVFTSDQKARMLDVYKFDSNRAFLRDLNEPSCSSSILTSEFAKVERIRYDNVASTWVTDPLPDASMNIRDNATPTDYNKTSDNNGLYGIRSSLGILTSTDITTGQIEANNTTGIFAANYGLSTIDIIKLTQHRSGSLLLPKPYGWIAADVTNDGAIDIDDDSELRKVILGINTSFPDVPSWRFLPRYYLDAQWNFETSFNNTPFTASIAWQDGSTRGYNTTTSYLDDLDITVLSNDLENADNWSFYATKSGDLDFSANVSSGSGMMTAMEYRERNTLLIVMPHEVIPAGTSFTLVVEAKTKKLTAGYQIGIKFDPSFFEVLSLSKGELSNFNLRDFNLQNTEEGAFKTIWVEDEARGINFSNRKTIFKIHCRAKRDIQNLSRLIILDDKVLETAFYDHKDVITGSEVYISTIFEDIPIILTAVYPNPTSSEVSFTFRLTAEKEVNIVLQDGTGRNIQHQSHYSVGEHIHRFGNLEVLTPGVIHYTILIGNEVKYSGQLIKF